MSFRIGLITVVALLVVGCGGGGDDEEQVREVVDRFAVAVAAGDDACADYVAPEGNLRETIDEIDSIAADLGIDDYGTCGYGEQASNLGRVTIARVAVTDDTANVTFENSSDVVKLAKVDGDWLITDVE